MKNKRNQTGLQGVHRYEHQPREGSLAYARWVATWVDDDGKVKAKTFSVKKFGETGAKNLAVEYRKSLGKDI